MASLERDGAHRLLLAVEAAPGAEVVIRAAARLAQRLHAEVVVLSVRERACSRGFVWDVRPAGDIAEVVNHAMYELQRLGVKARGIIGRARMDRVADEIVYAALRYRADQIVIGCSRRSKFAGLFLSSVCPRLLRLSPLPVVTIPTKPVDRQPSLTRRSSGHFQPAL